MSFGGQRMTNYFGNLCNPAAHTGLKTRRIQIMKSA
jgi:hypothetical protein